MKSSGSVFEWSSYQNMLRILCYSLEIVSNAGLNTICMSGDHIWTLEVLGNHYPSGDVILMVLLEGPRKVSTGCRVNLNLLAWIGLASTSKDCLVEAACPTFPPVAVQFCTC